MNHYALLNLKMIYFKRILKEMHDYEVLDVWNHGRWRSVKGLGANGLDDLDKCTSLGLFDGTVDLVMILEQPHRINLDDIRRIKDTNPNVKFVLMVMGDFRFWRVHYNHHKELVDMMDLIFDWQYNHYTKRGSFQTQFPYAVDKFKFFPHCVVPPTNWADVKYNKNPQMKCLFTGRVGDRYHIRNVFLKQTLRDSELNNMTTIVKDIRSESYTDKSMDYYESLDFVNKTQVTKDKYIDLINSHFCAIVGSTFRKHLLGKFMEYPAGGALLIADEFADAREAGFVPGVNFVEVTKETVAVTVKDVLRYPEDYERIRKNGFEFVRDQHTIYNRIDEFNFEISNLLGV